MHINAAIMRFGVFTIAWGDKPILNGNSHAYEKSKTPR
jgi:hypothetical protein